MQRQRDTARTAGVSRKARDEARRGGSETGQGRTAGGRRGRAGGQVSGQGGQGGRAGGQVSGQGGRWSRREVPGADPMPASDDDGGWHAGEIFDDADVDEYDTSCKGSTRAHEQPHLVSAERDRDAGGQDDGRIGHRAVVDADAARYVHGDHEW